MPSCQKLALNCNSRWRYQGSKFDSIPYKPFKICSCSSSLELTQNQRDLYGAVSNFHTLYFGWEIHLRGNFWQGPFSKDALLENGTKSHNFTNLIFCDVAPRYCIYREPKLFCLFSKYQSPQRWRFFIPLKRNAG